MFVFELKVKIPNEELAEEILDKLDNFLIDSLYRHGQILYRELPIIKIKNEFKAHVDCVEIDSLNPKNQKYYVKKYLKEIEKLSNNKIEIKYIGEEFVENTKCCGKQTFLILYFGSLYSPIRCGDCFEPIPIYSIPETYEDGKGYDNIFFWKITYKAYNTVWFQGIGEKFALKQLSETKSDLSKMGIELCKNIERVTGKPIFYFLKNYKVIKKNKDKMRRCPGCNCEWLLEIPLHGKFSFKCNNCNIVSEFL